MVAYPRTFETHYSISLPWRPTQPVCSGESQLPDFDHLSVTTALFPIHSNSTFHLPTVSEFMGIPGVCIWMVVGATAGCHKKQRFVPSAPGFFPIQRLFGAHSLLLELVVLCMNFFLICSF